MSSQGNQAAESIELFGVAFVNFALGGAMVFLDPQRMPPGYRKMVRWFTTTDRGRKRLGWALMALAVFLVAIQFAELFD